VDARPLPAWGFYARNVGNLVFDNVRLRTAKEDLRPVLICDGVERLTLSEVRFPRPTDGSGLLRLGDVGSVELEGTDLAAVRVRCTAMKWAAQDGGSRIGAGKPLSVSATVAGGRQPGLGSIDLTLAGHKTTRWVWLGRDEKREIEFRGLLAPGAGSHELRCGDCVRKLRVEP
jgi:hypothetical protein